MDGKGSEMEDLTKTLSDLEVERDYYRQVAERLGQKALADAQDFSQMIRDLRQREIKLHQSQEKLEQTIEERTAELLTRNKELSESTLRYDNLVKRIPLGVYILRVRDTGAMQFEYLSPPLCRILDIAPEKVQRTSGFAFSIAHPDDREELESSICEATERCIPFRWEGRFIIRQEVRWIRLEADPTTTPTGDIVWNGVLSDITERRLIQEKLKESEERLNFLVKNSSDCLVLIDADRSQRYVSPAAERITGYPVSQLEGRPISTLIHPDDVKEVIAAWNEAVENPGKTVTVQYRHIHKTQGWVYSEAIAQSFLAEPAINGVIASVRDITEHKRLESFLKDIITNNPMSMQILDKDGCTLEVNHSYEQLFGSIPPADYSIFRDHQLLQAGMGEFFDQLKKGSIVRFPDTYFNAHDSIPEFPDVPAWIRTIGFPLDGSNEKPERFVFMHENITQRKQAEEATLNSNKLLQTIINTAPVRIFFKDKELRYMGCNNSFAMDAGVKCPEDLIGKDDYQLTWQEQADLYRADDLRVIESGIPKLSYDEPQTTPEGNQIWLRTSKVTLRNESNEIIGVLGMYEDITERKEAETDKARLLLRQRAILDNLPMMAWLKDTDSRLEMINEPYANACGHTIDECIGKTDLDLFPEEMAKAYIADDHEVCVSGRKKHVEEMISSPDGIKWHQTYKTPIYDENGLIIGTAGIAQDITDRKQAEEERERL
jgi:PAS domain S-box-containing protein